MSCRFLIPSISVLLSLMLIHQVQAEESHQTDASDGQIKVVQFEAARQVEKGQSTSAESVVPLDGERVYGIVTASNSGEAQHVNMIWQRDGKDVYRYRLKIGKSPKWRTWSYVYAKPEFKGEWKVRLEGTDNAVLGETSVTIGDETDNTQAEQAKHPIKQPAPKVKQQSSAVKQAKPTVKQQDAAATEKKAKTNSKEEKPAVSPKK